MIGDETMSIHREDLDQERIDFGDVASGERFPPIAPCEILRTEFLEPMEISVYALAKAIKVTRSRGSWQSRWRSSTSAALPT